MRRASSYEERAEFSSELRDDETELVHPGFALDTGKVS